MVWFYYRELEMLKLIKCCLCIALLAPMLSGCANKQEIAKQESAKIALSQEQEAQQKSQIELTEKIALLEKSALQWQAVKPSVERLVSIEDELNALIEQLNSIIVQAETDKQTASQKIATQPQNIQKDTTVEKVGHFYTLQLSSLSRAEKVESAWTKIYNRNHSILSAHQPIVETININEKVYFRIKTGKFSSKDSARKICKQLEKQETTCLIKPYLGQTMAEFKMDNAL